jgi:hypothetical protein
VNLVLTLAIGDEYQRMAKLTHPAMKRYAERVGAEFLVIDRPAIATTTPHWEKFQIADLLDRYERICYLDTDILVRDDCPSLFDEVPTGQLGMFNEAPFTDRSKELMIDICRQYGVTLAEWDGKYYNSGVIVASRCHQELFRKPEKEVFSFYEQSYLNMVIAQGAVPMHELHYRFNRMVCMDRVTGEDRHASYVIHYAGALNSVSLDGLLRVIHGDIDRLAQADGDHSGHRLHLYVSVNGGLGDQLCAEPAVRFMREQMYPNDEMVVATHWPRAFRHLTKLGVTVVAHGRANLSNDTPYFITQSLPGPDTLQWRIVSHLLCHSVDYTAMALMKRTLPFADKQMQFEVGASERKALAELVPEPRGMVAVHPGRHWNSKTFPVAWWQAVIDGLVEFGRRVCIVGQDALGDPPDFTAGARGTVDVVAREGVLDLRNTLTLGVFAALLEQAGALVSNDSAPVHLAGSFDPFIVLIPSCKHPDHILPFRHGSQQYKTKALYKRLVIDTVEARPTQVYSTSAEVEHIDWAEFLPEVEDVVLASAGG